MERSVDSLTYRGSVSDAIVEAQKQKKLFVVYISGGDDNSKQLDQLTWVNDSVAESISRYCVFLHLMQGSTDALQFSAIYPQKSVPSISAVGYNGVMLWQHEGFIDADSFAGNIEKAWAALHVQETAVTLLTAAIAAKQPENLDLSSGDVAQGSSSGLDTASTSAGKSTESSEDKTSDDSMLPVEQMVVEPIDDQKNTGHGPETASSDIVEDVKIMGEEKTCSKDIISEEMVCSVTRDVPNPSTFNDVGVSTTRESPALDECQTEASPVSRGEAAVHGLNSSQTTSISKEGKTNEKIAEPTEYSNVMKSNDIYLNIRLPNGASLQRKFAITDTLKSVNNYVDENQINGFGSYDLAMPYPRRVFNEQDMNSNLSELGFAARQGLIVVPHCQATRPQRDTSPLHASQNTASTTKSTDDNGGYFAFVKRVLSYVNPFSYLGGNANSSNSESAPSDSYQQYRPNHASQGHQFSGAGASTQSFGLNQQNPSAGGDTRRQASRPFGSNIHTLRHDEDDFQSTDRNTFWNGNSTQFGGDDKK